MTLLIIPYPTPDYKPGAYCNSFVTVSLLIAPVFTDKLPNRSINYKNRASRPTCRSFPRRRGCVACRSSSGKLVSQSLSEPSGKGELRYEKNTCSSRAISKQQKPFAVTVWRLTVIGLLFSAVISFALPRSKHAGAASQPAYSKISLSAGANPSAAKIGNLDGDGRNDIAVVNLQGSLQLFFGNPAGSFDRISLNGLWPIGSNALDLDIGDLNGDGRNDIAVAFSTQTGAVSVLFNQGARQFGAPVNYNTCNSSK
ncbi:MAG TPA: VCBS repeat-containing protein, partial [Blastocatellia bacterium]